MVFKWKASHIHSVKALGFWHKVLVGRPSRPHAHGCISQGDQGGQVVIGGPHPHRHGSRGKFCREREIKEWASSMKIDGQRDFMSQRCTSISHHEMVKGDVVGPGGGPTRGSWWCGIQASSLVEVTWPTSGKRLGVIPGGAQWIPSENHKLPCATWQDVRPKMGEKI